MRLSEFVGEVNEAIVPPLEVSIPESYEKVSFVEARDDHSFWMLPEEVGAANATGDLPAKTGYFQTKITLNVAYDRGQGIFTGLEDRDDGEQLRAAGITDYESRRVDLQRYPGFLVQFRNPMTGSLHYGAYIATLHDGIVFFITYVPPTGDAAAGAATWRQFVATLEQGAR